MHHYTRFLGAVFIAGLLAACSGGGGTGGAIPSTGAQPPVVPGDLGPQQRLSPEATLSQQSTTSYSGQITGLRTGGGFTLYTGSIAGHVPVATTSSTIFNTYRAKLQAGSYAIVLGTGTSSSFTARYVALYPTAPTAVTITGSVTGLTSYGFVLYSSTFGHLPVMVSHATSGTASTGTTIAVRGTGSTSVAVLASSLTTSGSSSVSSTPAPILTTSTTTSTGVPKHVLTGDYFDSPWGTTSVSPARARPYLDWVRTGIVNANVLHAAGFKVEIYSNPNRVQSNDPLYSTTSAAGFAKTCSSSRVYDRFAGITQFVTVPGSSALKTSYGSLVAKTIAQGHVDAMFEDNAGALEDFGVPFYASLPCGYTDSTWITGEEALEDSLPVGTIFNGLSAFHDHGVSLSMAIVRGAPKNMGGEIEHCFSDNSHAEQGSWPWTATENTQLQVTAVHKLFQCQAVNSYAASSETKARIYTLASFLMTYNPSYSVLWELFGTPSGLHVMPESQFVALDPTTNPSNISQLKQAGGSYVRIYNACYYAGRLVGKCAMAVNSDYYAHTVSLPGFHHTLALSGNGILDGGTVSFAGAAPPSTLAATSAVIALP